MLILSRKENEELVIDRKVRVRLLKIGRGRVSLGIVAPQEVKIYRAELLATQSSDGLESHEFEMVKPP